MKLTRRLASISLPMAVALLLATAATGGQGRPDFSGRWTTEPETPAQTPAARGGVRGGGRGDPGSGWGSTITITQNTTVLTVQYAFFGRGDMQPPLSFKYALDGGETRNSVMMGRGIQQQTSTTTWEGDTLVITTRHAFPHPETGKPLTAEVRQTLSLESPTTLVVETLRRGVLGGPDTTARVVYRKIN